MLWLCNECRDAIGWTIDAEGVYTIELSGEGDAANKSILIEDCCASGKDSEAQAVYGAKDFSGVYICFFVKKL